MQKYNNNKTENTFFFRMFTRLVDPELKRFKMAYSAEMVYIIAIPGMYHSKITIVIVPPFYITRI